MLRTVVYTRHIKGTTDGIEYKQNKLQLQLNQKVATKNGAWKMIQIHEKEQCRQNIRLHQNHQFNLRSKKRNQDWTLIQSNLDKILHEKCPHTPQTSQMCHVKPERVPSFQWTFALDFAFNCCNFQPGKLEVGFREFPYYNFFSFLLVLRAQKENTALP